MGDVGFPVKNIVFDLDGTLVDSAPAILAGFESAFSLCNIPLTRNLSASVIGPPLMDTLKLLAGTEDSGRLQALAEAFKQSYDGEGYRCTTVFAGIDVLLQDLQARGCGMYIATNKRKIPTLKIVHHLGWDHYFKQIYALDSVSPPAASKGILLQRLLQECDLDTTSTLYIGDRNEDGIAAQFAGLEFVMASWGYNETMSQPWRVAQTPSEILALLPK